MKAQGFGDAECVLTGDFNTDLKIDEDLKTKLKLIGLHLPKPDDFPYTVNKERSSMQ